MKQALQAQMEEKTRKKEAEKQRLEQEEMREEQRLRGEYNVRPNEIVNQTSDFGAFKSGMPAAPVVNKTLYNNHHQLSIIGSTQGQSQDLMRS